MQHFISRLSRELQATRLCSLSVSYRCSMELGWFFWRTIFGDISANDRPSRKRLQGTKGERISMVGLLVMRGDVRQHGSRVSQRTPTFLPPAIPHGGSKERKSSDPVHGWNCRFDGVCPFHSVLSEYRSLASWRVDYRGWPVHHGISMEKIKERPIESGPYPGMGAESMVISPGKRP